MNTEKDNRKTSEKIIIPTIGRIVHFYANDGNSNDPCAALVSYVHSERMVNLMVTDHNGVPFSRTSVHLVQPDEGVLTLGGCYCKWMPYQIKKPTGSESGEKTSGVETI